MPDIPSQMQAMAVDEFGGPDNLTLHSVPVPAIGAHEVLIRVQVAGVGVWDAMERAGVLIYNEVHFPRVLGGEGAGVIDAVGEGVGLFAVGDAVYFQSFMNDKGGAYAEYVAVGENSVARVPADFDMMTAGALPIAGITALSNLQALETGDEDKLMLWGASGGVGHLALQLAKRLGARVFAIASGEDGVKLCQDLGADVALDGRSAGIEARAREFAPAGFDTALILVGGDAMQNSLKLVRAGGVISFPNGVMPEPVAPDGVELKKADGFANRMLLDQLNTLCEIGDFRVHVAQSFALAEAAKAQTAMDAHYLGKIVLDVNAD